MGEVIAYHGTRDTHAKGIDAEGLKPGPNQIASGRQRVGVGDILETVDESVKPAVYGADLQGAINYANMGAKEAREAQYEKQKAAGMPNPSQGTQRVPLMVGIREKFFDDMAENIKPVDADYTQSAFAHHGDIPRQYLTSPLPAHYFHEAFRDSSAVQPLRQGKEWRNVRFR